MKTIRWGIIGCGDVTEVKSGPGFQKAENSELVMVMRRTAALAQDYAHRHGVPKWSTHAQDVMTSPDVDAVYIATPPASHKDYVLQCAQAGKPVYVEKPMSMRYIECQEMIEACKIAKTPLFVAYYRRALPRFLKVKELIESGQIGEVRAVSLTYYRAPSVEDRDPVQNWRVDPAVSGGGYFYDIGSHMLDFFDFLLGPIAKVSGLAANQAGLYKAEDIVSANFEFASGVQGQGLWCFSAGKHRDEVEIIGSKGVVSFGFYSDNPISLKTEQKEETFLTDNPPHVQQPLIQSVVNHLNGGALCVSMGDSAARTSWVMEQITQKYYGYV